MCCFSVKKNLQIKNFYFIIIEFEIAFIERKIIYLFE